MRLTARTRKFSFTAHVISSVGWLGAVAAFLVLSVIGLKSSTADVVKACYISMNLVGGYIILPLGIGAFVTGLITALGTRWGLFKQYWVATKFILTIGAIFLLVLHQFTAVAAAARSVSHIAADDMPHVNGLAAQLVADASLAVVVLTATTALSIYKPWGQVRPAATGELSIGRKIIIVLVSLFGIIFVLKHLVGGGFHHF